jgi:hypothetical protein
MAGTTILGKKVTAKPKGKKVDIGIEPFEGLTLTKTVQAGNEGDAIAKFEKRWKIAPGVHVHARAKKPEGRGGEAYFTVTAEFNKGGAVKNYAKGGSMRKVRYD